MSIFQLNNNDLTLQFNSVGAELTSICDNATGTEYLWNADPTYWKRHSPILFPVVGSLKNKTFAYNGTTYSVPQHGFARDMEFEHTLSNDNEIWFGLSSTEETKKMYPFDFRLELGYRLEDRKVSVLWKVHNLGNDEMYFSIGAHPAFYCPLSTSEKQSDYYISFDNVSPITYENINADALLIKKSIDKVQTITTNKGVLPIAPELFDFGALIIENDQCHQVSLLAPNKNPYLTVSFDAPLFGLWSPEKKNAPFVCIEPWYGRCDAEDYNGTLEEREWNNTLQSGQVFNAFYTIEVF